jgi:hypothetical protein
MTFSPICEQGIESWVHGVNRDVLDLNQLRFTLIYAANYAARVFTGNPKSSARTIEINANEKRLLVGGTPSGTSRSVVPVD